MAKLNVTISEIIKETSDVKTFRLKFNEGESMPFLPGQFVMVSFEGDPKNSRAYSISSSSEEKEFIEITVKIYPEGKFSPLLGKVNVGDKVVINGPFGHFNYRKEVGDDLVLIYGGTGIAPFRSVINTVKDNKWDTKITLIGSFRKPEDIIYKEEMRSWCVENVVTLTRIENEEWDGERGRISKEMLERYIKNKNSIVYLCGPNEMVDGLREVLSSIGFAKENVKFERWG